jgi:hypothetical protein
LFNDPNLILLLLSLLASMMFLQLFAVPSFVVVIVDAVFTTLTIAITAINIKVKGLFALAETAGQRPHIFMQSILEKGDLFDYHCTRLFHIITLLTLLLTAGVNELIRTYASLLYRSAVFSLEIVELNHNVSVWVKKIPSMMPQPRPHVLETVTCITLLHPEDATRAKELHLSTSSLNGHQQVGFENFLTSKQLDEFCHRGKYFISC